MLLSLLADMQCWCRHRFGAHDAFDFRLQVQQAVKSASGCDDNTAKILTMTAHADGYSIIKRGSQDECRISMADLRNRGLITNLSRSKWFIFERRATALLGLIKDVCWCSNGLRRVMCNLLLSEYPEVGHLSAARGGYRYVDLLMRSDHVFWAGVQPVLHDFYIQMIAEDTFKNAFGDVFIEMYPGLMKDLREQKTEGNVSLLDLSVQIFTVPTVVTRLVKHNRMLEMLFGTLLEFFQADSTIVNSTLSVNSSVVKQQRYQVPTHQQPSSAAMPLGSIPAWA